MLRFEEVAVLDRNSEYRGVPPEKLMENAGKVLSETIVNEYSKRPVIFFCGTGNNGGDAYVAARYLKKVWNSVDIKVYLIKGRSAVGSELARKNLDELDESLIVENIDWNNIDDDTLFVDALLGTGITGEIREPYRDVIEKINKNTNPVVSVDVPSGLSADLAVEPDITVTFHDLKEGMSTEKCGKIVTKDIGMPQKAETHTGPGEMLLYSKPNKRSHKGENGKVLIVGGGPYTGAPALSAFATYKTGVDLVHIATPEIAADAVRSYSPNFIVHELEGDKLKYNHVKEIQGLVSENDSVVIGPGLGDDESTLKAVRNLVKKINKPLLIDADALKAIAEDKSILKSNMILTPHEQEFRMICDEENSNLKDISEKANDFAKQNSVTLVLKGDEDYITNGKKKKWNDFGNEGMTVGGTGDVLSGVIGGLASKGLEPFNAARVGTFMTCYAGDLVFEKLKWGLTPDNIIEEIPKNFEL